MCGGKNTVKIWNDAGTVLDFTSKKNMCSPLTGIFALVSLTLIWHICPFPGGLLRFKQADQRH